MMGTYRTQIVTDLVNAWNAPKIYDSTNSSVEDSAAEIAGAVSNSEHTALMSQMQTVMDSHAAMEAELKSMLQYLANFMSAFAAWVPTGNLSDAVQLKAACSSSAASVAAKCSTVEGKIMTLNTDLQTLSSDISSYKG
jgi:hypothetical protein